MKFSTVKENMTKKLVTVHWNEPIEKAYTLMEERRIRHLPVVNQEGTVIGILSGRDVNRAMDPARPTFSKGSLVGDFMSWPAVTVEESASIREVAEGMIDEKISALLVSRGTQVVGIVTSEDLLRFLAKMLKDKEDKTSFIDFPFFPAINEAAREASSVGI